MPQPPHAPGRRETPEEPLSFVDRLLADEESKLVDEENWELYSQLEAQRTVSDGSLTFEARIRAHLGRSLAIELPTTESGEPFHLSGTVVDVGDGWVLLQSDSREFIVNTGAICSLGSVSGDALLANAEQASGASGWAAVLRRCGRNPGPVVVSRRTGSALVGRIVLAASDHFDIAVESASPGSLSRQRSIPIANVVTIELR